MKRWTKPNFQRLDRQGVENCIETRSLEQRRTKNMGLLIAPLILGLFETPIFAQTLFVNNASLSEHLT